MRLRRSFGQNYDYWCCLRCYQDENKRDQSLSTRDAQTGNIFSDSFIADSTLIKLSVQLVTMDSREFRQDLIIRMHSIKYNSILSKVDPQVSIATYIWSWKVKWLKVWLIFRDMHTCKKEVITLLRDIETLIRSNDKSLVHL